MFTLGGQKKTPKAQNPELSTWAVAISRARENARATQSNLTSNSSWSRWR